MKKKKNSVFHFQFWSNVFFSFLKLKIPDVINASIIFNNCSNFRKDFIGQSFRSNFQLKSCKAPGVVEILLRAFISLRACAHACVRVHVCVPKRVCVCERERKREKGVFRVIDSYEIFA